MQGLGHLFVVHAQDVPSVHVLKCTMLTLLMHDAQNRAAKSNFI